MIRSKRRTPKKAYEFSKIPAAGGGINLKAELEKQQELQQEEAMPVGEMLSGLTGGLMDLRGLTKKSVPASAGVNALLPEMKSFSALTNPLDSATPAALAGGADKGASAASGAAAINPYLAAATIGFKTLSPLIAWKIREHQRKKALDKQNDLYGQLFGDSAVDAVNYEQNRLATQDYMQRNEMNAAMTNGAHNTSMLASGGQVPRYGYGGPIAEVAVGLPIGAAGTTWAAWPETEEEKKKHLSTIPRRIFGGVIGGIGGGLTAHGIYGILKEMEDREIAENLLVEEPWRGTREGRNAMMHWRNHQLQQQAYPPGILGPMPGMPTASTYEDYIIENPIINYPGANLPGWEQTLGGYESIDSANPKVKLQLREPSMDIHTSQSLEGGGNPFAVANASLLANMKDVSSDEWSVNSNASGGYIPRYVSGGAIAEASAGGALMGGGGTALLFPQTDAEKEKRWKEYLRRGIGGAATVAGTILTGDGLRRIINDIPDKLRPGYDFTSENTESDPDFPADGTRRQQKEYRINRAKNYREGDDPNRYTHLRKTTLPAEGFDGEPRPAFRAPGHYTFSQLTPKDQRFRHMDPYYSDMSDTEDEEQREREMHELLVKNTAKEFNALRQAQRTPEGEEKLSIPQRAAGITSSEKRRYNAWERHYGSFRNDPFPDTPNEGIHEWLNYPGAYMAREGQLHRWASREKFLREKQRQAEARLQEMKEQGMDVPTPRNINAFWKLPQEDKELLLDAYYADHEWKMSGMGDNIRREMGIDNDLYSTPYTYERKHPGQKRPDDAWIPRENEFASDLLIPSHNVPFSPEDQDSYLKLSDDIKAWSSRMQQRNASFGAEFPKPGYTPNLRRHVKDMEGNEYDLDSFDARVNLYDTGTPAKELYHRNAIRDEAQRTANIDSDDEDGESWAAAFGMLQPEGDIKPIQREAWNRRKELLTPGERYPISDRAKLLKTASAWYKQNPYPTYDPRNAGRFAQDVQQFNDALRDQFPGHTMDSLQLQRPQTWFTGPNAVANQSVSDSDASGGSVRRYPVGGWGTRYGPSIGEGLLGTALLGGGSYAAAAPASKKEKEGERWKEYLRRGSGGALAIAGLGLDIDALLRARRAYRRGEGHWSDENTPSDPATEDLAMWGAIQDDLDSSRQQQRIQERMSSGTNPSSVSDDDIETNPKRIREQFKKFPPKSTESLVDMGEDTLVEEGVLNRDAVRFARENFFGGPMGLTNTSSTDANFETLLPGENVEDVFDNIPKVTPQYPSKRAEMANSSSFDEQSAPWADSLSLAHGGHVPRYDGGGNNPLEKKKNWWNTWGKFAALPTAGTLGALGYLGANRWKENVAIDLYNRGLRYHTASPEQIRGGLYSYYMGHRDNPMVNTYLHYVQQQHPKGSPFISPSGHTDGVYDEERQEQEANSLAATLNFSPVRSENQWVLPRRTEDLVGGQARQSGAVNKPGFYAHVSVPYPDFNPLLNRTVSESSPDAQPGAPTILESRFWEDKDAALQLDRSLPEGLGYEHSLNSGLISPVMHQMQLDGAEKLVKIRQQRKDIDKQLTSMHPKTPAYRDLVEKKEKLTRVMNNLDAGKGLGTLNANLTRNLNKYNPHSLYPEAFFDTNRNRLTERGENWDFGSQFLPNFGFMDALKFKGMRNLPMGNYQSANITRGSNLFDYYVHNRGGEGLYADATGGTVRRYPDGGYGVPAAQIAGGLGLVGAGAGLQFGLPLKEDSSLWKKVLGILGIAGGYVGGGALAMRGIGNAIDTFNDNRRNNDFLPNLRREIRDTLHDNSSSDTSSSSSGLEDSGSTDGEVRKMMGSRYVFHNASMGGWVPRKDDGGWGVEPSWADMDPNALTGAAMDPNNPFMRLRKQMMPPGMPMEDAMVQDDQMGMYNCGGKVHRYEQGGDRDEVEKKAIKQGQFGSGSFNPNKWAPTQGGNWYQPSSEAMSNASSPHLGYSPTSGNHYSNPNLQGGSWGPLDLVRSYKMSNFRNGPAGWVLGNVLPFSIGAASPLAGSVMNTVEGLGTGNAFQAVMGAYPLMGQMANYHTGNSVWDPSVAALTRNFKNDMNQWSIPGVLRKRTGDPMTDFYNIYRAAGLASPLLFR